MKVINTPEPIKLRASLLTGLFCFLFSILPLWQRFFSLSFSPCIILLYVLTLAYYLGLKEGLLWGFFFGLLIDLFSGTYYINTVSFMLLGALFGVFKSKVFQFDYALHLIVIVTGTIFWIGLNALLSSWVMDVPFFIDSYRLTITTSLHALLFPLIRWCVVKPN